jgi:hypothetical protein
MLVSYIIKMKYQINDGIFDKKEPFTTKYSPHETVLKFNFYTLFPIWIVLSTVIDVQWVGTNGIGVRPLNDKL